MSARPITALAQSARLINISTNGQVGVEFDNMVGGFVIGGGPKTVLVRAIGPGLGAFGVQGTLEDPFLTLFDSAGRTVATNDNWNATDAGTIASVGAFPLPAASKDAVLVATLQPGAYTAQISGRGERPTGAAILEVYEVSGTGRLVNIATRLKVGSGASSAFAGFVIAPGSGVRKLLIRGIGPALAGFGLPGTLADPKLVLLDAGQNVLGTSTANGGIASLAGAYAQAGAFAAGAGDAAIIATVAPGNYTVQLAGGSGRTEGVALVEVYDITDSTGTPPGVAMSPRLLYSRLYPATGSSASTASGYATVLLDPNTNASTVSVSFSGLSTGQTGAHLTLGRGTGNFVLNLPRGQAAGIPWNLNPTGPFSTSDILAALLSGNLAVQIDSANFPGGELVGTLAGARGSATFVRPEAPPALPAGLLASPSPTDAARFLTQATFGPTSATVTALQARGMVAWIDDQLALPATSVLGLLRADQAAFPPPPQPDSQGAKKFAWQQDWFSAWWKLAATAPDQLRQRVAFALSQIFVIGANDNLDFSMEPKARYYDLLIEGAFGSFRTLLEKVTLSPAMGIWLSHKGNLKANPVKGTAPDENYAREVMQLFTIGLVQLQPDGSLILDNSGQPIPTYNQDTIAETAKVLTGWTFSGYTGVPFLEQFTAEYPPLGVNNIYPKQLPDDHGYLAPMRAYAIYHETSAKAVVSLDQVPLAQARPTQIPAGQTAEKDLKDLLDTLFNHPNTGPFISRQLIQRLVTSNPSPGYIFRVAQVFANDGSGTRGNLGAVVRAILTDYEARSSAVLGNYGYGKIKEPLIRMTGFLRALNVTAANGRYMDSFYLDPRGNSYLPGGNFVHAWVTYPQAAMWAQTVFNFYSPTYSPPGAMAAGGLVAPEMQIMDANWIITVTNRLTELLYRDESRLPAAPSPSPWLRVDYSPLLPNARTPAALVDYLNLLFCANQMTASTRGHIISTLTDFPATATDLERVQTAIHLTLASPDGALQK